MGNTGWGVGCVMGVGGEVSGCMRCAQLRIIEFGAGLDGYFEVLFSFWSNLLG